MRWDNSFLYQTELFSPGLFLVPMGTIGAVNSPGILKREFVSSSVLVRYKIVSRWLPYCVGG